MKESLEYVNLGFEVDGGDVLIVRVLGLVTMKSWREIQQRCAAQVSAGTTAIVYRLERGVFAVSIWSLLDAEQEGSKQHPELLAPAAFVMADEEVATSITSQAVRRGGLGLRRAGFTSFSCALHWARSEGRLFAAFAPPRP
jgi:hypothetical protein